MAPPIRLIFLGTGDFALPAFEHLAETGHDVAALVTQPDRPQGRKQEIIPAPIKRSAEARGIPVFQPEDVNTPESLEHLRDRPRAARHRGLRSDPLGRPALDPRLGGSTCTVRCCRRIAGPRRGAGDPERRHHDRRHRNPDDPPNRCRRHHRHRPHRDRPGRDRRRARGAAARLGAPWSLSPSPSWPPARSRSSPRKRPRSPGRPSSARRTG